MLVIVVVCNICSVYGVDRKLSCVIHVPHTPPPGQ